MPCQVGRPRSSNSQYDAPTLLHRYGLACPGHPSRHGAGGNGRDKPGHDDEGLHGPAKMRIAGRICRAVKDPPPHSRFVEVVQQPQAISRPGFAHVRRVP